MIIIAHDGQITIDRVQRFRRFSGRFLVLSKQSSSNTMYSSDAEFETFTSAKTRLLDREEVVGRKSPSDAVFDMLTQDMWIYDSHNEAAKKVYSLEDKWIEE